MPPPLIGGGIKRCFCLTSVAYIGRNSRTERPRKTKIGKEIAYVTRDSDTNFKVKWSKDKVTRSLYSARPQRVRRLQRSAWECIRRGKVLLRCVCSAAREGLGSHGEERGGGILCRHAHSLLHVAYLLPQKFARTHFLPWLCSKVMKSTEMLPAKSTTKSILKETANSSAGSSV